MSNKCVGLHGLHSYHKVPIERVSRDKNVNYADHAALTGTASAIRHQSNWKAI